MEHVHVGHIISYGNQKIHSLLEQMNINFKSEYQIYYKDKNYRYDFAILDKNNLIKCFIEYDGQQHFYYTNYGWNTKDNFKKQQDKDKDENKNDYAREKCIPLIRIPYYDYNKINIEYLKSLFFQYNIIIDFY